MRAALRFLASIGLPRRTAAAPVGTSAPMVGTATAVRAIAALLGQSSLGNLFTSLPLFGRMKSDRQVAG